MCDDSYSIIFLFMMDIELKETNRSCDPDAGNKLSFQPMQNLALLNQIILEDKTLTLLTVTTTKMTDAIAWVY